MRTMLFSLVFALVLGLFSAAFAKDAPDFKLKDLNGKEATLEDLLDDCELLVIDYWQVGCKPCNELLPHLQEIFDTYKEDGVEIVIISRDTSLTQSQVAPFFSSHDYSFRVLLDGDQEVSADYGVKSSPATFIIKPDNEIILQHYGYKSGQEKEIEDVIKRFLAGEDVNVESEESE